MTRLQFMTLAFYAASIQHSLSLHVEATGKSSNAAALRQPVVDVLQKALDDATLKAKEAKEARTAAQGVADQMAKKLEEANKIAEEAKTLLEKLKKDDEKVQAEIQKAEAAQLQATKEVEEAETAATAAVKVFEDAKTAQQTADGAEEAAIQQHKAAKQAEEDVAAKKKSEAAKQPSAKGDPHLSNMQGEFFDINRAGVSTFLQLATEDTRSSIRVDAAIEHPGEGGACFGFYIRKLWFKGSLVGEDIVVSVNGTDLLGDDSLVVQIGDQLMQNSTELSRFLDDHAGKYNITLDDKRIHMHDVYSRNRVKFATLKLDINGAKFVVDWTTGQNKPNILGFSAENLKQLGKNWRGLLASDDHTWASSFDPSCRTAHDYANTAQLVGNDVIDAWSASAHLD